MASPSGRDAACVGMKSSLVGKAAIVVLICVAVMSGIVAALVSASGVADATYVSNIEFSSSSSTSSSRDIDVASEDFILGDAVKRDMSEPISQVKAEEEAARLAAEEAAREAERQAIARATEAQAASSVAGGIGVYDVDFTIGRDAFIEMWTARIDAYLAGSVLAGYGSTFATAAWEAGIDPRWSPAISNTESSKGSHCFASHNAWGWTGGSWSDWETAINAHVQGLAKSYGFTISYSNAAKYCPPNTAYWYSSTLSEMQKI